MHAVPLNVIIKNARAGRPAGDSMDLISLMLRCPEMPTRKRRNRSPLSLT
jgi:hypothetical protein